MKTILKAKGAEKAVLMEKYKKLRNQVTSQVRRETIQHIEKQVSNAKSESEIWIIVNEVIKPNKEN